MQLAKKNPKLPIVFEVSDEVVLGDEYAWYLGSMSDCEVGEYAILDERVYTDREEFELAYYDHYYYEINKEFSDEDELDAYLKKISDEKFVKATIVSIVAG